MYWGAPNGTPLDVEITVANATTPMVRDPVTGTSQAPTRVQKGAQDNRVRIGLPVADHPLIVDFTFGNSSSYGTSVEVKKEALPRVEEIIFRHQQAQAAQDAVLQNYIAHVRIEQHFHPSPADPAYNLDHRESAVLGSRRRRVGGAQLRAERREMDGQSSGVSARAARKSAVAAARPAAEPGLRVPAGGRRDDRRTPGVRRPVRSGRSDARALSRDGVDRSRDVRPAQSAGGRDEVERPDRLERRDADLRAVRQSRRPTRSGWSLI